MHVAKLPSGNYRVWVKVNGKTTTATAPTRAKAYLKGANIALAMADDRSSDGVTVLELLSHHLAVRTPNLSPTTVAEYERVIDRLDPDFANTPILELKSPSITRHYDYLLANGWSVGPVRRLHELLHAAFKQTAIYRGWADTNPADSAQPPRRTPARVTPPDNDTLRALLDAADDQFRLYLHMSHNTGARRGELVALRWSDINLDTGVLRIFRSLAYTPESGVVERQTKTGEKGQRRVTVAANLLPHLRAHRATQQDRLVGLEPTYIFSHTAGIEPWHPDTPTGTFDKLRRKVGVTGVRLHDLRHYTATQMLAKGYTPVQVAGRLGHSNPTTTLNTYAHWIELTDRAAADDLFGGLL